MTINYYVLPVPSTSSSFVLISQLASGEVFGPDQPIALRLLGSERSIQALEGMSPLSIDHSLSTESLSLYVCKVLVHVNKTLLAYPCLTGDFTCPSPRGATLLGCSKQCYRTRVVSTAISMKLNCKL